MHSFINLYLAIVLSIFGSISQLKALDPEINRSLYPLRDNKFRVFTRSYGFLLGVQGGKYTFIEMGVESHWRKIALTKPRLLGLCANVEYNFGFNTLGYKAGIFHKVGRINFTYGLNLNYYTNFENSKVGLGPAIGFKLLGFHLLNGYNFMFGRSEFKEYNTLYVTIRYFFPLKNKVRIKR